MPGMSGGLGRCQRRFLCWQMPGMFQSLSRCQGCFNH
jgi:cell fate regulator YaaT (PSP1 superfamily)